MALGEAQLRISPNWNTFVRFVMQDGQVVAAILHLNRGEGPDLDARN
jgi:hypothetical protein